MKKILLISYYYPPANFVGGQRTAAWAKYLREFGYYPIVITRQWNENQTDLVDELENNELIVEKNGTHEVHRLPYKRSLRDKLAVSGKNRVLQKALTFKELIFSNFSIKALPYANFYSYCKELITKEDDIKILIASGTPFQSFAIGHQLKNDFSHIHWIPDYRDKWTNNESNPPLGFLQNFLHRLNKKSEQKWTKNSSAFITTSEKWKNDLSLVLNKPGIISANGFDINLTPSKNILKSSNKTLNLLYMGSLYGEQNFSVLFKAINEINNEKGEEVISLTFLGSYSNEEGLNRLKLKTKELNNVKLIKRVPHKKVVPYLENSDLLILTRIEGLKGIIPVKAYDYYNSNKPILLCPSDKDLMEQFIVDTESGFIANNVEDCKKILFDLLEKKKAGEVLIGPRNTQNATFYSRRFQTQLLAEGLDKL